MSRIDTVLFWMCVLSVHGCVVLAMWALVFGAWFSLAIFVIAGAAFALNGASVNLRRRMPR